MLATVLSCAELFCARADLSYANFLSLFINATNTTICSSCSSPEDRFINSAL